MKHYELVLIYDPLLADEAVEAEINKMGETIQKLQGKVLSVDKWGRRKLAYEVKKKREGVYTIINFQGNNKLVSELDRILKIYEPVLRHMIVRQELPTAKAEKKPKPGAKEESTGAVAEGAPQEA